VGLPVTSSNVLIGEIRNSSNSPLVRSRTTDSAIRVIARCWRIRASTAGPKYWTTVGQSYLNFRLDQAPDFVRGDPDDALDADVRIAMRQLSERVFGLSDLTFGVAGLILFFGFSGGRHPRLDGGHPRWRLLCPGRRDQAHAGTQGARCKKITHHPRTSPRIKAADGEHEPTRRLSRCAHGRSISVPSGPEVGRGS
jgi:hypothetical protein